MFRELSILIKSQRNQQKYIPICTLRILADEGACRQSQKHTRVHLMSLAPSH